MKTIIIAGPTGSGKTNLGVKLCKDLNGIIINADSRQVYKGMDIGTNKGNIVENVNDINIDNELIKGFDIDGVTGYLFNLIDIDKQYDVATYKKLSLLIIRYLTHINKLPILVGGTGLYLDSLIKGYDLNNNGIDLGKREKLSNLAVLELQEELKKKDINIFNELNNSDKNNPRRLIRLLEKGGFVINNKSDIDPFIIYPKFTREELYLKIDNVVDWMFKKGFVDEVKRLVSSDYQSSPILLSMGYIDVLKYIKGGIDLDTCIGNVKRSYRNYAKRQITWFEGEGREYELNIYDFQVQYDEIKRDIANFLNS